MGNVAFDPRSLKAIVFDVDGTLYRQAPVRITMLFRILRAVAAHPIRGLRVLRILTAYRSAQEDLRRRPASAAADLAAAQLRLACERTNGDPVFAASCVTRWMEEEPLAILSRFVRPGLKELLDNCKARGLRLGVLSDYPCEAKIEALGLGGYFDVLACTRTPDIGYLKPHPRGLVVAAQRLAARPSETLYVGDRPEVDAAAAAAAGMPCAIIRTKCSEQPRGWLEVSGFSELETALRRS